MSRVIGNHKAYVEALTEFRNDFNPYNINSILYGVGYSLSDLPFFNYSKEEIEHEKELFNKVVEAYEAFEDALNEAVLW